MAINLGEFGNQMEIRRKIYQAMQPAQSSDRITRKVLEQFQQLVPGLLPPLYYWMVKLG